MEKNTPNHIQRIISDLHHDLNKEKVLLRYTHLLSKDVSLLQIFLEIGFCLKSNKFTRPINESQVLSLFNQEYNLQKSNIENYLDNVPIVSDNDFEVRQELLRVFYESGINEFTSSAEIGLEPQEDHSLCMLFQDFPSTKSLFSTPKPKKDHKSPSTQATKYLTPSPMKTPYSEESEIETPRSIRGLKQLTQLVKQIICKHQPTSFKNVASKLIEELIITEGPDRVKEEKNVRRRVYDAINVLIASEVLERNGRNVSWKEHWDNPEVDYRENDLEKKRSLIEDKKKGLKVVLNKFLAIRALISRNKRGLSGKPAINFPFIIVSTLDAPKNTMSIKVNADSTFLQLKLAKAINLFGDMDVLLSLGMHKMKMVNLLQYLPNKDLLGYCTLAEY